MNEQRRAVYSGHVQGVGFRATTQGIAARFQVAGFVRNLADGRVELVAEGASAELDAFLAAVADRLGGFIRELQIERRAAMEGYSGFDIRSG